MCCPATVQRASTIPDRAQAAPAVVTKLRVEHRRHAPLAQWESTETGPPDQRHRPTALIAVLENIRRRPLDRVRAQTYAQRGSTAPEAVPRVRAQDRALPAGGARRVSHRLVAAAIARKVTGARQDPLRTSKTSAAVTTTTALLDRRRQPPFPQDLFLLVERRQKRELVLKLVPLVSTPRMELASTVPLVDMGTQLLRSEQPVLETAPLDTIARGDLVLQPMDHAVWTLLRNLVQAS